MTAGSSIQGKHSLKHVNIIRYPEQPYEEQMTSVLCQLSALSQISSEGDSGFSSPNRRVPRDPAVKCNVNTLVLESIKSLNIFIFMLFSRVHFTFSDMFHVYFIFLSFPTSVPLSSVEHFFYLFY